MSGKGVGRGDGPRETPARLCATLAIVVGFVGVLAWAIGATAILGFGSRGTVVMKANTALLFMAAGLALWLRSVRLPAGAGVLGTLVAGAVGAFAGVTLLEDLLRVDLGIDQLLFTDVATDPGAPGRMTPITAVAFILVSASLLASDVERGGRVPAQWAALVALLLSFAAFAGWLYGEPTLLDLPWVSGIAPPTTVTLMVLALGCLLLRPDRGIAAVILGRGKVGLVARRFIPLAALLSLAFPWIELAGLHAGIWNEAFGRGVSAVAKVAVLGGLAYWTVAALAREQSTKERQQARLRALLEVLPIGVVFCEAGIAPGESNSAARALFGGLIPSRAATPHAWWSETGEPAVPGAWGIAATCTDGRTRVAEELDVETLCGRRTILSYAAAVRAGDEVVGAVGGFIDVTERKRAERELVALQSRLEERVRERTAALEAANQELESFAYSVSHDLRAPLRAADGFASLLEEAAAAHFDEEQRTMLQRVRAAIRRMAALIEALLALSRAGRALLQPEPVDLAVIAREVCAELMSSEPQRHVDLEIPVAMPAVGDPVLLRAVMENLLANAWKFTRGRDPARITLSVGERDGLPEYTVADNGMGFNELDANRLFEPFYRAHAGVEGTGVGLALVRRVVARHGGTVRAEGVVGRGASFGFTLGSLETPA